MRISTLFTCLLFIMSGSIMSQTISIHGRITLQNSNLTLPGINVFSKSGNGHTITDIDGNYKLNLEKKEDLHLMVSGIGFQTIEKKIDFYDQSEIVLNLSLKEEIIDLPIIEINAHSTTGGMMGSMDIPGSSHYISNREIQEIQSTNPHEILQRIPGIQIQEEDGFGLRPNIGLRASGSERSSKITILEDGVLAAPAPYAAPSAYYFPTMARMSGIEVRKGASQLVEGPYTTGGIINFISTPVPSSRKAMLRLGGGSFGARNLHANFGDTKGGFGYMVETFQYNATGFKTIDFSDNQTGFDKKDYIGKLKWTSSSEASIYQNLSLKVGESNEHSDETYLGLSYGDFLDNPYRRYAGSQQDEMNTKHRQVNLKHLINPLKDLYIQTTIYRNTFERNWYKLDKIYDQEGESTSIADILNAPNQYEDEYALIKGSSSQGQEALSVKANNRSYTAKGIQSKINYFSNNHSFEFGIRYHYDEMDRFQWVDQYNMNDGILQLSLAGKQGTESNRIEKALALAMYLQYSWENESWNLQGGVRREKINLSREDYGKSDPERNGLNLSLRENDVVAFIPGISITYKISDQKQVFAGIHRGFAPPGSSPSTNPEKSINYEFGYRMEQSNLYASAVLFMNDFENLLGSDLASSGGIGSGDQFNGGAVKSYGMEISMNYRKKLTESIWMPIQFQYTYNHAAFQNDFESSFEPWGIVASGDFLPYLAPHNFSLSTGLRLKNLHWNITGSYMDEMRIKASQGALGIDEKIDGRFLVATNFRVLVDKNVNVLLGVQNLFDKRYAVATRPAGWRPGAPRNISAGVQVNF